MSAAPSISVILPTHNPDPARLARTLSGLRGQTLPPSRWELLIIDNASRDPASIAAQDLAWHSAARIVREPTLGLTPARLCGFNDSHADLCALVDDDNVLHPTYLQCAVECMNAEPTLGALGGPVEAEFEVPPPTWTREFDGLLAVRDCGPATRRAVWRDAGPCQYPECAPIGAGMIVRRSAIQVYIDALARDPHRRAFDRTGLQLVSGGDNDIVMTILEAGFAVGYEPALRLTHLIPARRIARRHLGALNRAIARSWVRVLALHGIEPWPPARRSSLWWRQVRAGWRARAWRGPAEWVRWQGLCGVFEGRADLFESRQRERRSAYVRTDSASMRR